MADPNAPVWFDRFDREAWRLEVLDDYPADRVVFEAWLRDEPWPRAERDRQAWWLTGVRQATRQGKRVARVHVLRLPLTAYLRFELDIQQANVAAGEDIRIARSDLHPELAALGPDFWLFDGECAQLVLTDPEAYADLDPADPATLAGFRAMRETALRLSVPLGAFLADLEPVGAATR